MTTAVAQLVEVALLLPSEARNELVEALLERSEPSEALILEQVQLVEQRMARVGKGETSLIDEDDAHRSVIESLDLAK